MVAVAMLVLGLLGSSIGCYRRPADAPVARTTTSRSAS